MEVKKSCDQPSLARLYSEMHQSDTSTGGIQYTAHGAQKPPFISNFVYFLFLYFFRLGLPVGLG